MRERGRLRKSGKVRERASIHCPVLLRIRWRGKRERREKQTDRQRGRETDRERRERVCEREREEKRHKITQSLS